MTQDKSSKAREWLLERLENGVFKEGERLPGAREIAADAGMSLLTAQAAIKTLERDGILEIRPRSGCYVKPDWRMMPLETRLYHFASYLPWMARFKELLESRLPGLKLAKGFKSGIFEIRTTIDILSRRSDYIDVAGLFREAFPDASLFYERPFRSFWQNGRLLGVPFIFSPRVMVFNPEIFRRLGCKPPRPGWTWDEFLACVRSLRAAGQPKELVCGFSFAIHDWMNFVLMAGGSLFDPSAPDPVKIDSPETRQGLRFYKLLQEELGVPCSSVGLSRGDGFCDEGLAMLIMPREFRCWLKARSFESWDAVELPRLPGVPPANVQATDIVCVRRECKDRDLAVEIFKLLLSEETQDFIGAERYGIPIRISSAERSRDLQPAGDAAFFEQIGNMSADYNLDSPDLSAMVGEGLSAIWREGLDIEATTAEIASAVRTYMKVRSYGRASA